MDNEQYQAALAALREEWGALQQDQASPGILRATNDPTTGVLVGRHAALFAEIINRALDAKDTSHAQS